MIELRLRNFLVFLSVSVLLFPISASAGFAMPLAASGPTWDEVLATYEDPSLTSVQRDEFLKGLDDLRVENWQGIVEDVSSFMGSYSAWIDMPGNEDKDIHLAVTKEEAIQLNKGTTVSFSGKIWDVDSLFGFSLWVRDVAFGDLPAAAGGRAAQPTKATAPTQSTTSQKIAVVKVRTNGNLRAGPGTNFAVVGAVKAGQNLQVVGRTKANDWFATVDGKWVSKVLLLSIPAVPEATNIPTPPKATVAARSAPAPGVAPKAPTFGAGTKVVGKDIAAGTYRTRGGNGCYWERLKGFGGSLDEIAANNIATGPEVVTITAEDKGFNSQRCGTWTSDLAPITNSLAAPFGQGKFIVNTDIAPGTWQASGGEGCYWERLSGFGGVLDDIIANNVTDGPAVVTIAPNDVGFNSARCGTWTKID
jgi:hypothetical protein